MQASNSSFVICCLFWIFFFCLSTKEFLPGTDFINTLFSFVPFLSICKNKKNQHALHYHLQLSDVPINNSRSKISANFRVFLLLTLRNVNYLFRFQLCCLQMEIYYNSNVTSLSAHCHIIRRRSNDYFA